MTRLVLRHGLGLLRASHPEPAVAVTTVTVLLAVGVGHRPAGALAVGAAVLASQLAVGWTNDWLDAGRDAVAGRADKPVATGAVRRDPVGVAGVLAALATPVLALISNATAAACLTAALVSALLYNWPLKRTPLSVLPYMISFAALPAFIVLALPGAPAPPAWLVVAGALLGGGAHFANVLPDLDDDARTGVRGLPHRLGAAGSRLAAMALLLTATLVLVLGPPGPPGWVGWAALATAAVVLPAGWYVSRAAQRRGSRSVGAFRAVMLVAVVDVLLLVLGGRVV
ncbi:4-hydroxybenzoate polyprenyltransferase [Micromonospora pattaloongensis]|uniref:4-hydroxybenzoate polyprenyltransferase n=2 Tax=Micromonospora pattaloongensis TaxID=405436 RepID=A0A1H3H7A0_9ACTN|nr:UbiA family prenyltransferase [Micromonospora pattaloongensis]SDY11297.1 4-hydroxybenzoate polyprenyltransferase [Micromonospora pattaloongensis]